MPYIKAYVNAFFNHELYHGWNKSKKYFEGWYFKLVSADASYAYAFIPGIAMDEMGNRQAFVQVLDGKGYTAAYHKFDASDFYADPDIFFIRVGSNSFSLNEIVLDLPNIKGVLSFNSHFLWPKKLFSPGIMGWYAFVPAMECYHQVVSMDYNISGSLQINNEIVDYTNGKGYLEKDWGRSFPSSWIWMQSNHFSSTRTSFKLSVAKIPWMSSHFIGFISAFLIRGKLIRFATYTGAKLKDVQIHDDKVSVTLQDKKYNLKVIAYKAEGADLAAPILGMMDGRVKESMDAVIHVQLIDRKSDKVLFDEKGKYAGLEIAGNVSEILEGY